MEQPCLYKHDSYELAFNNSMTSGMKGSYRVGIQKTFPALREFFQKSNGDPQSNHFFCEELKFMKAVV